MTSQYHLRFEQEEDAEKAVADYLVSHPEFLADHPEVLAELAIPHATGGAVSLLERQLAVLRAQNRQYRNSFRELVGNARENVDLGRRMHRLTVTLLHAPGPREILKMLLDGLVNDFRAERVALRIFGRMRGDDAAPPEFVGRDAPARSVFEGLLGQGNPVCGRIKRSQLDELFGTGVEIGSAVIVPLAGRDWDGVLAIASADTRRYYPDMATDLLAHLGDIASLVFNPWVHA